jgi:hypothetical protein
MQRHNTENSKLIFLGKELRGYSLNSYIHVSVSDLYIPQWVCLFCCQKKGGPKVEIYRSLTIEAGQFLSLEYINPNFFAA